MVLLSPISQLKTLTQGWGGGNMVYNKTVMIFPGSFFHSLLISFPDTLPTLGLCPWRFYCSACASPFLQLSAYRHHVRVAFPGYPEWNNVLTPVSLCFIPPYPALYFFRALTLPLTHILLDYCLCLPLYYNFYKSMKFVFGAVFLENARHTESM